MNRLRKITATILSFAMMAVMFGMSVSAEENFDEQDVIIVEELEQINPIEVGETPVVPQGSSLVDFNVYSVNEDEYIVSTTTKPLLASRVSGTAPFTKTLQHKIANTNTVTATVTLTGSFTYNSTANTVTGTYGQFSYTTNSMTLTPGTGGVQNNAGILGIGVSSKVYKEYTLSSTLNNNTYSISKNCNTSGTLS